MPFLELFLFTHIDEYGFTLIEPPLEFIDRYEFNHFGPSFDVSGFRGSHICPRPY
jgi:hypothetical protein